MTNTMTGLLGQVISPDHPNYDAARRVWNGAIDRRPAFIVRCRTAAEVAAAVRAGVRHGLTLAVRGGGHSVPGHSVCEGGLVIDLGPMRAIELDGGRVHVGPGVLLGELDAALEPYGLAVPAGEVSHTGIAGLTLGGGVGWLSRKYGLACDNLVAAQIVTADGAVAEVEDPELLWGLRGGGGNFGVVTRFTFRTNPIPVPMFAGMVLHPAERAGEGLRAFFDLAADAPDDLGLNAALGIAPPAPFVPPELRGRPVVALAAAYAGPLAEGAAAVRPLREFAPPAADLFGPTPYTALQSMIDEAVPHGLGNHVSSEWLRPLDDAGIGALVAAARVATSPMSQVLVRVLGGAIARVPADDTAFRFRHAAALLTLAAIWPDPAADPAPHRRWCHTSWAALSPWSAGGAYVNGLGDEGPERVRAAYGPRHWDRLVALKRRYDPDNVFALNQNIPPGP